MKGQGLRMAVIGCGYFGEKHADIINELPNAELAAVCDVNEEAAVRLSGKLGCKYYTDIETMLKSEEIDAVSIAVSETYHLDAVRPVAAAGKDILLEKPIARNTEEALEILRLAKENNIRLMVGHVLKWDGRYQYTAEAVKKGELGDVISMYFKRSSTNGTVKRLNGKISMFHYMGVHDFEAMLTFAEPAKPVKVYSQWVGKKNTKYNGKDTVFNTITFDNGIVASIQLCWALPDGSLDFVAYGEVVGTEGVSYIDIKDQGLSIYRSDKPVEYPELTYWPEYYGHVHGKLREEIAHFVTNTLSGEPYVVDNDRAVEAVRTIDACFESLRTGMPAEIRR
ncbi:MAG: Gfo/Idh/MocA family oxidoreductase [Eubacteriales bacterium]|nr:Gfo/Idh/MocA family oxidoreductase [Eubacteriales bacterium]